jgi:hypothetical protein
MKKDGRVNLACDHIGDETLFKAVIFAITIMRGGVSANVANARSAKYYQVNISDVAYYTGQHAARIAASKRGRSKAFEEED